MFEWLTGRKKRKSELPLYSGLRETPNRGLPRELQEKEASQEFSEKRALIESQLCEPSQLPPAEEPLFTVLVSADGDGLITAPVPDGTRCLPVFSSPIRAADYKEIALEDGPDSQFLVGSPVGLMNMLRDLESVAVTRFMLDCCPRCGNAAAFGSESMKTTQDVLVVRGIITATALARADLYFTFALDSARAGQLEAARDVTLEAIGHVTMEDPRLHFLLGELGVGLRDQRLVQEAKTFLKFLSFDEWERKLDDVVRAGVPDFR